MGNRRRIPAKLIQLFRLNPHPLGFIIQALDRRRPQFFCLRTQPLISRIPILLEVVPLPQFFFDPPELVGHFDARRRPIQRQPILVGRNLRLLQILVFFRMVK